MDRSVQWSVDQVHRGVHGPGVSVLGSPLPRGRYRRDLFALLQIPNTLNTKFDLQYLLCIFYVWMWFSTNSFLSVRWWRGVSKLIWYRLTGEFWINSTAWDFCSVYRLLKKLRKKKAFYCEIVSRGIQPYFLHGGALGLFWNATRAATFWRILSYIFYSMVKEIYVFINVS